MCVYIAFDMSILCEAMLVCLFKILISIPCIYCSFREVNFSDKTTIYFYLLPFGCTTILCIDVCVVILARTDSKSRLLPEIFILEY